MLVPYRCSVEIIGQFLFGTRASLMQKVVSSIGNLRITIQPKRILFNRIDSKTALRGTHQLSEHSLIQLAYDR